MYSMVRNSVKWVWVRKEELQVMVETAGAVECIVNRQC